MAKKIQWSLHRDDRKIGTEEVLEDEMLAQRYVDTGMATFVDEPVQDASEPVVPGSPAVTDAGKAEEYGAAASKAYAAGAGGSLDSASVPDPSAVKPSTAHVASGKSSKGLG